MTTVIEGNLTKLDRAMRIIIGISMCIAILLVPMQAAWIAALSIASLYPLMSGLTAIDPFLAVANSFLQRPVSNKSVTPTGAI